MNLEKIFASTCRRKILKILSKKKSANIMELVYAVNSSYNEVHRNLQILEEEGIVVQNRTLNKRIIFFNTNEKTVDMLKALDVLEQINLSIAKQAKNAEGQQTEVLY